MACQCALYVGQVLLPQITARCRAEESEFRLLQNEVRLSYFPEMTIIKARFISVKKVIIFN